VQPPLSESIVPRADRGGGLRASEMLSGALPVAVAILLLAAAGLKAYELIRWPVHTHLISHGARIAEILCEMFLGLWLLSGVHVRLARIIALTAFGAFSAVSLYHVLHGDYSCGCFGPVKVNPWWTLALDLAVMAALLAFRPRIAAHTASRPRLAIAMGACLAAASGLAVAALHRPAAVADDGIVIAGSGLVVLEPEKWRSKQFTLAAHIDTGAKLSRGKWIAVLYHYDCEHCRRVLPEYERMARDQGIQVALISIPPHGPPQESPVPLDTHCLVGRLDETREWFVEAPVEIKLQDGIVVEGGTRHD